MSYSTLTEHQTAKLPQWAQRHVEHLEQRIAEAERRIETLQRGAENTDTIADIYSDQPLRLPMGTRVRYQLGEKYGEYIDALISERRGQRVLEVHAGEMMIVCPVSGNVASIAVDPR